MRAWGLSVAALLLAVTVHGRTAWGETKDGLQLGVEYVRGADGGVIRVLVRNVSSNPMDPVAGFQMLGGEMGFAHFSAARSDGTGKIDLIDYGHRVLGAPSTLVPARLHVGAGETRTFEFPLKYLRYTAGGKPGGELVPFGPLWRQGFRVRVIGVFDCSRLRLEAPWISRGGAAGR